MKILTLRINVFLFFLCNGILPFIIMVLFYVFFYVYL